MHARNRKMADTLGENRKFRVFSLVCMQRQEYSRYGKPDGPNVRVSHALKVTLLSVTVTHVCVLHLHANIGKRGVSFFHKLFKVAPKSGYLKN